MKTYKFKGLKDLEGIPEKCKTCFHYSIQCYDGVLGTMFCIDEGFAYYSNIKDREVQK